MATKAILDIELTPMERFAALFDKVRDQIAQMPEAWKSSNKELDAMGKQLTKIEEAWDKGGFGEKKDAGFEVDKERLRRLQESDHLWTNMSRSSQSMAKNVLDIGTSLLKWGSIIGGAGLFGSMFGIDRLAHSIGDTRSSSMGFGVSP